MPQPDYQVAGGGQVKRNSLTLTDDDVQRLRGGSRTASVKTKSSLHRKAGTSSSSSPGKAGTVGDRGVVKKGRGKTVGEVFGVSKQRTTFATPDLRDVGSRKPAALTRKGKEETGRAGKGRDGKETKR